MPKSADQLFAPCVRRPGTWGGAAGGIPRLASLFVELHRSANVCWTCHGRSTLSRSVWPSRAGIRNPLVAHEEDRSVGLLVDLHNGDQRREPPPADTSSTRCPVDADGGPSSAHLAEQSSQQQCRGTQDQWDPEGLYHQGFRPLTAQREPDRPRPAAQESITPTWCSGPWRSTGGNPNMAISPAMRPATARVVVRAQRSSVCHRAIRSGGLLMIRPPFS